MIDAELLKKVFIRSIPVLAGYAILGIGFGILAVSKGYNVWWILAMSLLIYGGSMQFVGIELMAGGASIIATAIMTIMVHARHIFYGVSMIDSFKDYGKEKYYMAFALTDETYSLICDKRMINAKDKRKFYLYTSILNHIYWVLGTVIGGILGTVINFNSKGVDFSMTALFLSIFVEQWVKKKDHKYAIIGVVSSIICLIIFGSSNFIIPDMLLITFVLWIIYKKQGDKK